MILETIEILISYKESERKMQDVNLGTGYVAVWIFDDRFAATFERKIFFIFFIP